MDVYFEAILIVGGIIFIKLVIIICAYACRVKRLSHRHSGTAAQNNNNGEESYPANEYNSRSPIVNFEETPQPIYTVAPGSESSAIPSLGPPPYEIAAGDKNHKPPSYDQVLSEANINICETGQETVTSENVQMESSQHVRDIGIGAVRRIGEEGQPPPYSNQDPAL